MRRSWEGRSALKGAVESRFRRVGDVSAEVRCERRVVSEVEEVVRARAMLQAFAPRSRTWGKCRFTSCVFGLEAVKQVWMWGEYKQALAQSVGYLVSEVVDFSACLYVCSGAFSL